MIRLRAMIFLTSGAYSQVPPVNLPGCRFSSHFFVEIPFLIEGHEVGK